MGLFDFFFNNSERELLQTGSDFKERKGPFGERVREGQYRSIVQKRTDKGFENPPQGIFGLFGSKQDTPQIQGKKDQRRLKPKQ